MTWFDLTWLEFTREFVVFLRLDSFRYGSLHGMLQVMAVDHTTFCILGWLFFRHAQVIVPLSLPFRWKCTEHLKEHEKHNYCTWLINKHAEHYLSEFYLKYNWRHKSAYNHEFRSFPWIWGTASELWSMQHCNPL